MTALDIMNQARERLGDEKEQRWTNNRLLSIISQGQVDICTESGYIRKEVVIPLVEGVTIYGLPFDCFTIKRVEYQDTLLPLHTRSDKDVPRATTSEYIAYKSNLNTDSIEIQPPATNLVTDIAYIQGEQSDDSFQVTPLYGVIARTDDPNYIIDPIYGVTIDAVLDTSDNPISAGYGEIAGTNSDVILPEFPNGVYGVVTSMEVIADEVNYGFITDVKNHVVSGAYGLVTAIANVEDTFKVYYVASPAKLKFITAILALPDRWEALLLHYVVGTALQDDNDANNIQRGELEIAKYEKKLNTIKDLSSKDFSSSSSDKLETSFRRV